MKTAKTKLIELSGGFHNSSAIRVRVPADFHIACDTLIEGVSELAYERLNRHFCGIKGCTCGGVQRASIYMMD